MLLALHGSRAGSSKTTVDWTKRLRDIARTVALAPVRFVRHRQVLQAVAQMNEHELRDIGLTRQDVGDATALPVGQDPSGLLAARATERRRPAGR